MREPTEPAPAAASRHPLRGTPPPRCDVTGREHHRQDLVPLDALWLGLAARIRVDHPDLAGNALISRAEAARYRTQHIDELLRAGRGAVCGPDRGGAESPRHREILDRLKRVGYSLAAAQQARRPR
jgi:hypothetical protein